MRDQERLPSGIHFLMPFYCWESIQDTQDKILSFLSEEKVPTMRQSIDPFHYDYKEHLLSQIKIKSNIPTIQDLMVTPKIKTDQEWKILCEEDWNIYKHFLEQQISIPIIYDNKNPDQYFKEKLVEVKIIFSSEKRHEAYIGFVPSSMKACRIVSGIGSMMGYFNFHQSSVYYDDHDEPLDFSYLQRLQAGQIHEVIVEIRGLAYNSQKTPLPYTNTQRHDFRIYEREIEPESLTTKVDTPIQAILEEEDQELSRINQQIFSTASPEIIRCLRQKAKVSMKQVIPLPEINEETAERMFDELCRECLDRRKKSDLEEYNGTDYDF